RRPGALECHLYWWQRPEPPLPSPRSGTPESLPCSYLSRYWGEVPHPSDGLAAGLKASGDRAIQGSARGPIRRVRRRTSLSSLSTVRALHNRATRPRQLPSAEQAPPARSNGPFARRSERPAGLAEV